MVLASLISSFYLLISPAAMEPVPPPVEQAVQAIRQHHLETADGRLYFLEKELMPFINETQQLNQEMQELAYCIENESSKEKIVTLGEELNAKMALLGERLPHLISATQIDKDLEQLDAILDKQEPLEKAEEEILLRVASLASLFSAR